MFNDTNQIKQALLYSIKYSGAMNVKNEYLHKLYNQACKQGNI